MDGQASAPGDGSSPIFDESAAIVFAAERGASRSIHAWVSRGGDINRLFLEFEGSLYNPVQLESLKGNTSALKCLLDAGADPNGTALQYCRSDIPENTSIPLSGHLPILLAAKNGREGCVRVLLEFGVDANTTDEYAQTPLHYAVVYGHREIATTLAQFGADIIRPELNGLTPIQLAAESGQQFLANYLTRLLRTDYAGGSGSSSNNSSGNSSRLPNSTTLKGFNNMGRSHISLADSINFLNNSAQPSQSINGFNGSNANNFNNGSLGSPEVPSMTPPNISNASTMKYNPNPFVSHANPGFDIQTPQNQGAFNGNMQADALFTQRRHEGPSIASVSPPSANGVSANPSLPMNPPAYGHSNYAGPAAAMNANDNNQYFQPQNFTSSNGHEAQYPWSKRGMYSTQPEAFQGYAHPAQGAFTDSNMMPNPAGTSSITNSYAAPPPFTSNTANLKASNTNSDSGTGLTVAPNATVSVVAEKKLESTLSPALLDALLKPTAAVSSRPFLTEAVARADLEALRIEADTATARNSKMRELYFSLWSCDEASINDAISTAVEAAVIPSPFERLKEWLNSIGCLQYLVTLVENGFENIDFIEKSKLTYDDCSAMGITTLGHRKKLTSGWEIEQFTMETLKKKIREEKSVEVIEEKIAFARNLLVKLRPMIVDEDEEEDEDGDDGEYEEDDGSSDEDGDDDSDESEEDSDDGSDSDDDDSDDEDDDSDEDSDADTDDDDSEDDSDEE